MMGRKAIALDLTRVETLASQGHTQADIARQLGISLSTLMRRKRDSDSFDTAIQRGQEAAHSAVSNALYQQAIKGNVPAIQWYEKTRRGFKDTVTQEVSGVLSVEYVNDWRAQP